MTRTIVRQATIGLVVSLIMSARANADDTVLAMKVTIQRGVDISELCFIAHIPCLIAGTPPQAPEGFQSRRVNSILNQWLKHSAYGWSLDDGVLRISPRSRSVALLGWLDRRVDLDIENLQADKAMAKVFNQAGIVAGLDKSFGFKNSWYPPVTIHAKQIAVHEALARILKQDPPLEVQIKESSLSSNSVQLSIGLLFKAPR